MTWHHSGDFENEAGALVGDVDACEFWSAILNDAPYIDLALPVVADYLSRCGAFRAGM